MTSHRTPFAAARTGALGGLALLALLAACEAKLPTETDVANMDVAAAEQGATRMRMFTMGDTTASYTLDGRAITAAEARALKPEQIGGIQVVRKRVEGRAAQAQVSITSRKPGDVLVAGRAPAVETRIVMHSGSALDSAGAVHRAAHVGGRPFDGLLMIDGAKSEPAGLRALRHEDIVSVEVLKGPEAAKLYTDPAAARGVIRITTKAGAK